MMPYFPPNAKAGIKKEAENPELLVYLFNGPIAQAQIGIARANNVKTYQVTYEQVCDLDPKRFDLAAYSITPKRISITDKTVMHRSKVPLAAKQKDFAVWSEEHSLALLCLREAYYLSVNSKALIIGNDGQTLIPQKLLVNRIVNVSGYSELDAKTAVLAAAEEDFLIDGYGESEGKEIQGLKVPSYANDLGNALLTGTLKSPVQTKVATK